jgi:protein-disulfide isomerase
MPKLTETVKTCARGPQGKTLLGQNIALNKELQIMYGPTYLLNNQEIFSSRGVPTEEELKKMWKK